MLRPRTHDRAYPDFICQKSEHDLPPHRANRIFFKGAAGPCSQLRKLLLHVLSRRLVASVGIVGDVMGRWCRRRPPRVVVGAEEDRGELFGGGRGCGSEMGCRQSLSGFNLGKAPGSA
jgi:hypothetical protein